MEAVYRHFVICLLTGLVTLLPVGGTFLLLVYAENSLSPLIPARFYFPGAGLLSVIALLYLLGLTLTTVLGRWLWHRTDALVCRLPGLGLLYRTLKQILGLDPGEGALFERVVLVPDEGTGGAEIGLVTGSEGNGEAQRLLVFVPHSPNPAQGRLLRLSPGRVIPTDWSVDRALKGLFSLGKF
ncbi:MAG TPA: DUF502 domain-containing protein [candidate division Zixibacteria bacterium]|nr:DUF502 domain-containing protein [candidate division Zixibacteria bacterium]